MDPAHPATMESSWQAEVIGRIEEQGWLDRTGVAITRWLQPLLDHPRAPEVMDLLHGRWLGHSLHPVLSDLPIGLWAGSMLLDLVGAGRSAGVLSAAGSAAAVATAVTGAADWTATDGRERRLGLMHGLLNTAGLGLQLGSLSARLAFRPAEARVLAAAGLTVTAAAAYLGGELVLGRGIGVNHDAWAAGPQRWTEVLDETELADGSMRAVEVEGRKILLYREGGGLRACEDACTHAGGPLSEGTLQDGVVTCPWHGSRFRLSDGGCIGGPATFPQLRLQARTRSGRIEVRGR